MVIKEGLWLRKIHLEFLLVYFIYNLHIKMKHLLKIFRSKNHKILSMVVCRRLLRLAHLVHVFPSFPNLPRS